MNKLPKYLNDLEEKISKHTISNPEISKSNVGWQIEHILLTINAIIENKNLIPKIINGVSNFRKLWFLR